MLIELNEATAARRRAPCRIFLSNGTAPDTGATADAVIIAINSGTTISAASTLRAMESAQGMYWLELTQSECSVLGTHALYHTAGDFPQHIATVQVVNSNPFSTLSALSDVTLHAGTHSDATVQGVTRVNSSVTPANALYSAVTVRLDPVLYSGATLGINNIAGGSYSDVTIQGLSNYANISNVTLHAGTHSNVTIQGVTRVNSSVTPANATYSAITVQVTGLVPASFTAGAIDAAALALDAGQEIADRVLLRAVAGGADSGRTVGEALMALRNRTQLSATSYIVYQEDDTTIQWHASLTTVDNTVRVTDANPV